MIIGSPDSVPGSSSSMRAQSAGPIPSATNAAVAETQAGSLSR